MSVPEGRSPRSPANFYAQAADLVRVRTLPCTRNGRSRHFWKKNTMVLAQFPSDPLLDLLWPRCLPVPPLSVMCRRCPRPSSTHNPIFWSFWGLENSSKKRAEFRWKGDLKSTQKCRKSDKKSKQVRRKGGAENMHIEIIKKGKARVLETLMFDSTPTRNRSSHFSRFLHNVTKIAPQGLRNRGS